MAQPDANGPSGSGRTRRSARRGAAIGQDSLQGALDSRSAAVPTAEAAAASDGTRATRTTSRAARAAALPSSTAHALAASSDGADDAADGGGAASSSGSPTADGAGTTSSASRAAAGPGLAAGRSRRGAAGGVDYAALASGGAGGNLEDDGSDDLQVLGTIQTVAGSSSSSSSSEGSEEDGGSNSGGESSRGGEEDSDKEDTDDEESSDSDDRTSGDEEEEDSSAAKTQKGKTKTPAGKKPKAKAQKTAKGAPARGKPKVKTEKKKKKKNPIDDRKIKLEMLEKKVVMQVILAAGPKVRLENMTGDSERTRHNWMSTVGEPTITQLLERDSFLMGMPAADREAHIRRKYHLETMRALQQWYKNQENQERRFRNQTRSSTGSAADSALTEYQELRRSVFSDNASVTGDGIRDSSQPGHTVGDDFGDNESDGEVPAARSKKGKGKGKRKGKGGTGTSSGTKKARGPGIAQAERDESPLSSDDGDFVDEYGDSDDAGEREEDMAQSASTNHISPRGGAAGAAGAGVGAAAAPPTGHRRRTAAVRKSSLLNILDKSRRDDDFKVRFQAAQIAALEKIANRRSDGGEGRGGRGGGAPPPSTPAPPTPAEAAEGRRMRAIEAYDRAVQARQMGLPSATLELVDRLWRAIDTPLATDEADGDQDG